jgi:hypothetical protein
MKLPAARTIRCGVIIFSAGYLQAQGVPVLERNDIEVGVFGASTFGSALGGLAVGTGSGGLGLVTVVTPSSNGALGAQVGWSVLRRLRIYGEWAYVAGGTVGLNQDYVLNTPALADRRRDLRAHTRSYDTGVGMHVLFPLQRAPKLVPYVQLGVSAVATSGGFSSAVIGDSPGANSSSTDHSTSVGVSAGGGFRYYFTERAGLRVELKGSFAGSSSGDIAVENLRLAVPGTEQRFGRFSFGVFYQIR